MAVEIPQSHIEAFIRDPVMAAYVFFGVEMDIPQQARLRTMWFVPEVHDSSGINLGKTEILFWWAMLRCILLKQPIGWQPRRVGIFYQTLGAAEQIFNQERFQKYLNADGARLFRRELKPMHGGKLGYRSTPDSIQFHFRNGARVECPAVGLSHDAKNLAGRRYHDGGTDEATQFEGSSNALENQILGRINAACFNGGNPIWDNHRVLCGHAEDPDTHAYYRRRILPARAQIRDGSQHVALITSSFRDWTQGSEFEEKYRKVQEIRGDKLRMGNATFLQIREGLWAHGTEEWYDATSRKKILTPLLRPEFRRESKDALYTLGWDTAYAQQKKNDWNFGVALKGEQLDAREYGKPGVFLANGNAWRISPCWALGYQNRRARESAGMVHRANQRFAFSRIVMDPGGGGLEVAKEMAQSEQFFDNLSQKVIGLCTRENAHLYPEASPIVHLFGRGDPDLQHVWGEERFRQSDEGPIHAIHVQLRNMIESRCLSWPLLAENRSPSEMAGWEAERKGVQVFLDQVFQQLGHIQVMVDKDGTARNSKRGFLMFEAKGKRKKDGAYAFLYALVAMLSLILDPDWEDSDEDAGMVAGAYDE